MNDSEYYNNAGVSPAPPIIRRLLFFYSFFRSSGSFVKEGSDLKNRFFDLRRLAVPDIDYITLRYGSTDYHPQRNKEIRMSGSKDLMWPPGLNNNVKSLQ
jgi:hypothetical protein